MCIIARFSSFFFNTDIFDIFFVFSFSIFLGKCSFVPDADDADDEDDCRCVGDRDAADAVDGRHSKSILFPYSDCVG